jgi:predicted GNAT family acetyltransferase
MTGKVRGADDRRNAIREGLELDIPRLRQEDTSIANLFHQMGIDVDGDYDTIPGRESVGDRWVDRLDYIRKLEQADIFEAARKVVFDNPSARGEVLASLRKFAEIYRWLPSAVPGWNDEEDYDKTDENRESVSRGLLRDLVWASMKGTPQRAAYVLGTRMAYERYKKQDFSSYFGGNDFFHSYKQFHNGLSGLIPVKGSRSGIGGTETDRVIGYEILYDVYKKAESVILRGRDISGLDEKELARIEHKIVCRAAEWIADMALYNPVNRSEKSSYSGSLEEAFAWAQLGEQVKSQLKGMRHKLQGMSLYNIGRFIGKSGDNPYKPKWLKLKFELKRNQIRFDEIGRQLDEFEEFLQIKSRDAEHEYIHDRKRELAAIEDRVQWVEDLDEDIKQKLKEERESLIAEVNARFDRLQEKYLNDSIADRWREYSSNSVAVSGLDDFLTKINELKAEKSQLEENIQAQTELIADVEKKMKPRESLAAQAIYLHFKQAQVFGFSVDFPGKIDWINRASFGTIKRTYRALMRGVSAETAFAYAKAEYLFPNAEMSHELIAIAGQIEDGAEIANIRTLSEKFHRMGLEVTVAGLIKLKSATIETIVTLLNRGYELKELTDNPWLLKSDASGKDLYPRIKGRQEAWCCKYSFVQPLDWNSKRIGKIIKGRLDAGVDDSIHDASYWFTVFEPPETLITGEVLKNQEQEKELLYTLLDVPQEIRSIEPRDDKAIEKALKRYRRYEDLFSSKSTRIVFNAILDIYKKGRLAPARINQVLIEQNIAKFKKEYQSKMVVEEHQLVTIEKEVEDIIFWLGGDDREAVPVPRLVGNLRECTERRIKYVNDAQNWVESHMMTPRPLLTLAWQNREMALADGCQDNPRAIKQWADLNSLRFAFQKMEKKGTLPDNIGFEDLKIYSGWFREMIRHYDGKKVIKYFSKIKEVFNPKADILPMKIDLGEGWVGEILRKNDPRGTTMGADTGCCMTIDGASANCIQAGYEHSDCGFFLLTRDDIIVAQSSLYTNRGVQEQTIVCDNIEANQGRDREKVIEMYRKFFSRYIETMTRRVEGFKFTRINVGEGYTEVNMGNLERVNPVPVAHKIYTDARSQRRLLDVESEKIERLKRIKAELVKPGDWEKLRDQIMEIERLAFDGRGYSEFHLRQEFSEERNIVIVLRDGDRVIGYSTALPMSRDELHVSSTAIHPDYQGRGLVSDLLYAMDVEATRQGYRYYQREANHGNGYAEKLKRNYEVIDEGKPYNSPLGTQQSIKVVIPDHRLPTRLSGVSVERAARS